MIHPIVSRAEWLDARKALLAKERAITHELDALREERRQLPWVRIEKPCVFEGPESKCSLGDLFGDRGRSDDLAGSNLSTLRRAPWQSRHC